MVTIDAERLTAALAHGQSLQPGSRLRFVELDDGDAYACIDGPSRVLSSGEATWAEVLRTDPVSLGPEALAGIAVAGDTKIIIAVGRADAEQGCNEASAAQDVCLLKVEGMLWHVGAFVRRDAGFQRAGLNVVPYRAALYERRRGILETPILEKKRACIFGLGTGGAYAAVELAKSGVGEFILVDDDRLDVGNVVRHNCGLADVGRFKTKAVADLVHGKNPYATVETHQIRADWSVRAEVDSFIRRSDLVICSTDSRESKLFVNRLCVIGDVTAVYGGAFRRAYGGQVLVVRPRSTPCYQCFVRNLPEMEANREITGLEEAEGIAYSDRPVPVEPGLSIDVAPICTMVAKIAVLELLRGASTTLDTLYDDLKAPWYIWANRREPDTDFANWQPLDLTDRMSVLRWYGVNLERDSDCPVCGEPPQVEGGIDESASSPPLGAV